MLYYCNSTIINRSCMLFGNIPDMSVITDLAKQRFVFTDVLFSIPV